MSDSVPIDSNSLANALQTLSDGSPLVQHLTNRVTMNDVAQVTLHWGGLPVMADTPGDAEEMVHGASAVLLNIGTASPQEVETMVAVGEAANELDVPVVFDPVGVGATPTRDEYAETLLERVDFAAIKGNYGEVSALAGVEADVAGVESVGEYDEIAATARALAASADTTVVASGVTDIVATGEAAYELSVGHERMGSIVGTGCVLGATLATFNGVIDDASEAALCGTTAFGHAGERAAETEHDGPESYRVAFLDTIAGVTPESVREKTIADRIDQVL
ncbi:hydroxyethylthiazole kinase, sugar kinase family [Halovivax ruber XH-70]|uniref:Hydroxyethylthiazole kinase n=1 Tax=Halovivax ruber (strain DSM 18193 / JCM 13892 / XH-70) TaxID=797302 RepID=L0ID16_HALRX|nr:hydroxyethylthiazole kinase [Halovivax ruber]AGB16121.1 hydroxyethylthiazole kinase, sugar kinase family [Halovivax ruber XH-70]